MQRKITYPIPRSGEHARTFCVS